MIGLGYSGTVTPPVIRRNVLENPAWYTAYTPYQPEISQGRLEALLTFQTMVADLTGLPVAGASLLDEATAAAEAMTLLRRAGKAKSARFVVDADTLPQTLAVLRTRAEPLGIELVVADLGDGLPDGELFGLLLPYPGASGRGARPVGADRGGARARAALVAVAADLLALTLLTPPGELGADVVVGTTQRFGVPLGFGGPHAGYLSVRQALARQLPGPARRACPATPTATPRCGWRCRPASSTSAGRRRPATSARRRSCSPSSPPATPSTTAPTGCAGSRSAATGWRRCWPPGCAPAASRSCTARSSTRCRRACPGRADAVVAAAHAAGVALRRVDADTVGIACSELTTVAHLGSVWAAFGVAADAAALDAATADALPERLLRTSDYLTHPVFHEHRSETSLMRWLRRLADADLALDRTMIPLGSCTMKLNAAAEMEPISWPGVRGPAPVRARATTSRAPAR